MRNTNSTGAPDTVDWKRHVSTPEPASQYAAGFGSVFTHALRVCIVAAYATPSPHMSLGDAGWCSAAKPFVSMSARGLTAVFQRFSVVELASAVISKKVEPTCRHTWCESPEEDGADVVVGIAGALLVVVSAVPPAGRHVFESGTHSSPAAQHSPMLAPAQHVDPAGQHEDGPAVGDRAEQHVLPSSQQNATLLAPGPLPPQHDCVAVHVVDARYHGQHLSVDPFGMHCGFIDEYPQHVSVAVSHVTPPPLLPAYGQFGSGVGTGGVVVVGVVVGVAGCGEPPGDDGTSPQSVERNVICSGRNRHVSTSVTGSRDQYASAVGLPPNQHVPPDGDDRLAIAAAKATPSPHISVPDAGWCSAAYVLRSMSVGGFTTMFHRSITVPLASVLMSQMK